METPSSGLTPISVEALAFVPRFVTAVCTPFGTDQVDAVERLKMDLEGNGVALEPSPEDGPHAMRIVHGGLTVGRCMALTMKDAAERFGSAAPFLSWKSGCPYIGEVARLIAWNQFLMPDPPGRRGAFTNIVHSLLTASAGFVFRLDTSELVPLVVERELPLSDLANRWGFKDGELFLTRKESAYSASCCAAAVAAMADMGLKAQVEWVPTSHNPLRLAWHESASFLRKRLGLEPRRNPALYGQDGRLKDVDSLDGGNFKIWCRDFSLLERADFWETPKPVGRE